MVFLFILAILCISENAEEKDSSYEIMEHMRNGKKFSELVDASIFDSIPDFPSDRLLAILNNIEIPRRSCYNDILYKLQFDCEKANEEQQKILAIHFTQCYYNVTGKLDQFPVEVIDNLKTSMMSPSVYSVYTSMKTHWKNLCRFSKQSVFTAETSHSLFQLYQKMVESMNSMVSFKKQINETFQVLNNSFSNITIQLEETAKNIDEMFAMFESFTKYLDPIISFIKYASEALYQMKFFSLVIIITLFFAIYIPKMIIPVTLLTVIFCFIDHFLGNHISKWNNSLYRQIFYYIYALTCFSYPAYLIIKYIIKSIKFISSLMSSNVKERRIKKKKN